MMLPGTLYKSWMMFVFSRTDMIWILAKMDDAWKSDTAKRILGQAGEKGS